MQEFKKQTCRNLKIITNPTEDRFKFNIKVKVDKTFVKILHK